MLLFIINLQIADRPMHTQLTIEQLRAINEKLDQQIAEQKQLAQQARQRFTLIQQIADTQAAEKNQLINKIKDKQLQKVKMARLTISAKIRLDQIHELISSEQGRKRNDLQPRKMYFRQLMSSVGDIEFLDYYILKSLCYQLRGNDRVLLLRYYIDWAFAAEYGGTVFKYIQSCWQDLKLGVSKMIDSIKSAMNWLQQKLKSAWNSLFG